MPMLTSHSIAFGVLAQVINTHSSCPLARLLSIAFGVLAQATIPLPHGHLHSLIILWIATGYGPWPFH